MPDVKMPDGTIIRNVPEGTTKAQLMARLGKAKPTGSFGHGLSSAATLGFLDEIGAVADTLGIGMSGEERPNIWKGNSFGDAWKQNQRRNEQILRQKRAENPGEYMAGEIAGAVLLPTSKLSAAKGLKGVAGSAAEGAAYGAAYGAGTAEGGLRERATGAAKGAGYGLAGGAGGRLVGNAAGRVLRGKKVSPEVQKLADEGIVMTPGQRGGRIAKGYEEGLLGSIPFVKAIPQAAKARGIEQLNVAAYNRALAPIGQKLPMNTKPGHEAVAALGDTVFTAYDDAASRLNLALDNNIAATVGRIKQNAPASVGASSGQLNSIIDNALAPLRQGAASGTRVRDILQDLRGEASSFRTSPVANERRIGDELWKLHDEMEAALVRQNPADALKDFKAARASVNLYKRVEAAAAKAKGGIFSPQQLRTAVTKRGYGTTQGKVARGQAPMQDLADAASQVLPATIPNSGTPERLLAVGGAGGLGALVDPTMGVATGLPLAAYAPGIDRLLQYLALNRPDMFVRGGNALAGPTLGTAGAITAAGQGR